MMLYRELRLPGLMKRASRMDDRRCHGFTLIEIVLTLGILVMLAAVAAITVGRGYERKQFDEGVRRFEATLRMARVEAATQGRRFTVSFEQGEDGSASVRVQWEAQPLTEPGKFSDYANLSTWSGYIPGDEIRILSCRLIGASAYRLTGDAEEDEAELQAITFYPDGSSDSALIALAPPDEDDAVRAAVRLDGVNAALQTFRVTDDELEENIQDIEQGLYVPLDAGDGDE